MMLTSFAPIRTFVLLFAAFMSYPSFMNALKSKTYGEVYLTNYIFSECATVLSLRIKDFHKAIKKTNEIKQLPIIFADEELFEEAWKMFQEQKEPQLSFVDCTIVISMRATNISHLATFDKAFKEVRDITVIS